MPDLTPVGALVRRADPDRFLTALFAPPARREALLTLYAFNHELARARESTSQPMLAMIRLQWWREVVEGARRAHEVATPLTALLEQGVLDPAETLALIDARETELDIDPTTEAWRAYLLAGPGGLAMAAGRVLGAPAEPRLRALGAAYGIAGTLRIAGRGLLPAGMEPALAAEGRALLGSRQHLPAAWRAAGLPGVLARRDLQRPGHAAPRGLGDRLAVIAAALTGRV